MIKKNSFFRKLKYILNNDATISNSKSIVVDNKGIGSTDESNGAESLPETTQVFSHLCPSDVFSKVTVIHTVSEHCKYMTGTNRLQQHRGRVSLRLTTACEESKRDLESEVEIMSRLKHENIVEYYNCYSSPKYLWLESEFCPHGNLFSLIQNNTLNEDQVASIAKQVLLGLNYLHENLIVHNQINSENILLGQDYAVKLTGFSCSKQLVHSAHKLQDDVDNSYWMSPEQIGEQASYGLEADIWSLGIVIWEMLNGSPPNSEFSEDLAKVRIIALPAPTCDSWSIELKDFMFYALNKNVSRRHTAKQLLQHPFITRSTLSTSQFIPDLLAKT